MMAAFSWFLVAGTSAESRDGRDAAVLRVSAGACRMRSGQRRADAAGNHATCVMASHADRREARTQQPRGGSHDHPDLMAATASRQETLAPGGPRSRAEGEDHD